MVSPRISIIPRRASNSKQPHLRGSLWTSKPPGYSSPFPTCARAGNPFDASRRQLYHTHSLGRSVLVVCSLVWLAALSVRCRWLGVRRLHARSPHEGNGLLLQSPSSSFVAFAASGAVDIPLSTAVRPRRCPYHATSTEQPFQRVVRRHSSLSSRRSVVSSGKGVP